MSGNRESVTAAETARKLVDELADLHGKAIAAGSTAAMDTAWEALNNLNDDLRFAADKPYESLDMADVVEIRRMLADLPADKWDVDFDEDVERMVSARDAVCRRLGLPVGNAA